MALLLTAPNLTEVVLKQLAERVYEASGIRLTDRQRPQIETRVAQRLQALRLDDPAEYEKHLGSEGSRSEEMEIFLDLLAVHESYFFREISQLSFVADDLVEEARERRGTEPVRIWSAGCVAGEEPYSLAMLLEDAEAWKKGPIDMLGTDMSATCLERARQAVYGKASLRQTSRARRSRFFEPVHGGLRVQASVRRRVRFRRMNLYREGPSGWMGQFDIILCRNLLLYFDVPARCRVVEALYSRLRPGGCLLLSRSETLLNVRTRLQTTEQGDEIVYRRAMEEKA
ncbi:MAG: protein-glutamate O-methyltransferase CheR [Acidobacteria bacterium]|nr:protein-glutamate O-methyltransferase CheR [Acidobacteriota bacterium]